MDFLIKNFCMVEPTKPYMRGIKGKLHEIYEAVKSKLLEFWIDYI